MDTQQMPDVETLLRDGINELRTGNKEVARRYLMQVVRSEPTNEKGWLYLAATLPPDKAIEALQRVLQINPNNQQAIRGIQALQNYATSIPGPGEEVPTSIPHALRNQNTYTPTANTPRPIESESNYQDYSTEADDEYEEEFEEPEQSNAYYSPYEAQPAENQSPYSFNLRDSVHFNPDRQLPRFDNDSSVTRFGTLNGETTQAQEFVAATEPDDLRSTLVQPYTPTPYGKRRSGWPVFLAVLLIVAILAIAGAIVYFVTQNPTPVANVPTATVTVAVSPTVATTVAPTATPELPTPTIAVTTAPAVLLPTSTPVPASKHLQVAQNQSAQLNAYTITFSSYDNHSSDFTDLGASPPMTGTHYEGVVVEVINNYNQTMPISVQQFQGLDGRNNAVTPLDTGRLPYLNVPRLQPGERRAAWLTFEVSDGTTLRAVIFNPATTPDNTSNVLANLVAAPAKAPTTTQPSGSNATAITPTPAPQSALGKAATLNNLSITVLSYDTGPNVHPFVLPSGYHYESVMIKVTNQGNQDIVNYLKSYPFELRDNNGYVFTVGPLALDGPEHFAPELFAANGKTPGLKTVTGELYFLVRDSSKGTARTLVWYNDSNVNSDRVEITLGR